MGICVKGENAEEVECVLEAERACGGFWNLEQISPWKVLFPLQMISLVLDTSYEPEVVKSQSPSLKFGLPFKIFSHIPDEVK